MGRLTDTALKALKPKTATYQSADGEGLLIEVKASGRKTWMYRYRLGGKAEKLVIGTYPEITLKEARELCFEARREVQRGESPARAKQSSKREEVKEKTVKDFGERFFREIVTRDRKITTIPRRYLDRQIFPAIGALQVSEVSAEDVRSIIWAKKAHGFDAAAADIRGLLKRLFDYAITCGLITVNPVHGLPARHVFKPKSRDRNLSREEIGVFLRAVEASNVRRQFKAGLRLVLLTMVRKSELIQARWSDVHLDQGEWHIPAETSKTGKPHIVYLSSQATALFKELRALASTSELVMPGRSSLKKPFAHNAMNSALKKALETQPIPVFTIHDLRRTASTLLHENGWPSDVVEKALNHTIGGVRGIYNRAEYAEQRKAMLQFWGDFVDAAVRGERMAAVRLAVAA
ncbi:tyrosine-type recombinase/integrase [Rivibacter subsaxonicus]|uniref:tyrosine-type recombinase/integrase n=1 Tax=Rivibacter subsaxonicus TaxID=457575 RepID=UPI001F5EE948|nr:tyrosine-type recombinase/integrase [Rivibacter subsaxonicus]